MSYGFLRRWALLLPARRFDDVGLLIARIATATFLIDGVWDNVTNRARMGEFVAFMESTGFAAPAFWAPFSVYTQLVAGVLLLIGLLTRWAGLLVATTFVVAVWMVHWDQALRDWWPALALVVISLMLASSGAGRFSLDRLLERRAA